jgi:hypothetical protein
VEFGERGKSFGRHSSTSVFKRGLTVSLAKGWPQGFVDLVKGSIEVVGSVFEVTTQVDSGWPLSAGLTRLIRPLALMTLNQKLGASQPTPLKKNLVLRFDNKTRAIPSIKTRFTREKNIFGYTSRYQQSIWNKRYKVRSLLPHRYSWGSGRWMCTWTTNSRQIPPAIQRYIPTNV